MTRPIGLAPGATALVAAWAASLSIALLTGATAVVILLALGAVTMPAAMMTGWMVLRSVSIGSVATDVEATAGDPLAWRITSTSQQPIRLQLLCGDETVAESRLATGSTVAVGTAPRRGAYDEVTAQLSSAGWLGLVWWRRTIVVPIATLWVAPRPGDDGAPIEQHRDLASAGFGPGSRAGRDDVDGVRVWRDGDEVSAVHWPSSLRSGELVIRQRLRDRDDTWVVAATLATDDADDQAARLRRSLERGIDAGARVAVSVDGGDPHELLGSAAVHRWCATFAGRTDAAPSTPWWRRVLRLTVAEPTSALTTSGRWLVAAAGAAPLVMLLQPLGYETGHVAVVLAATAAGAATTSLTRDRWRSIRQLAGAVTATGVGALLIDLSSVTSVVTSLRFLLPQLLVALVVLQGFECVDRRAARVSLACSSMLIAYSAGVRVDEQLAIWLLISASVLGAGLLTITRADRQEHDVGAARSRRRVVTGRTAGAIGSALAVLVILAVIPIPRGPAQLTLPSWLEERRPTGNDGALAAPDGSPLLGGSSDAITSRTGSTSDSDGGAGSYPGFSPTMDTSLRGDLGDTVVLRVRSPYPDFWRGQTFSEFDGRTWYVDPDIGSRSEGPEHSIGLSTGDVRGMAAADFIQTFYAEVDLPNLVFAAGRPTRVLLDAPIWQRPDGALRADVVLPAGSAYTVISQRSGATAASLRADGDLAALGSPPEFVQLAASTTTRTRNLAAELAAGSPSTYDTILSVQQWLGEHVEYDLDASVPPVGVDAVDDFLFESRRGFCEQIATSTAILLRSLGIPARVATGYVPSDRDEIAGVWISRASDAHAWVEVRFPSAGWVAFDPTASVPLAGEADRSTIGGDLIQAVTRLAGDHITLLLAAVAGLGIALSARRFGRAWWRRRQRGRWGLLQDRFVAAAVRRGAASTISNADMAAVFDRLVAADAERVATTLDASAFSSTWVDDDAGYAAVAASVRILERSATVTE
ncbi:MAG: transglutaminaseTgpA domain-containing protein [Ilumatobacteraceae bacterium]